jgi:uncharacterized membrane protein YfcA
LAVVASGMAAGMVNAVIGSGSLITFPTLLAVGYAPIVANVSNNIGLVAGGVTGAWGYREELDGQARTLRRLMPMSFLGSVVGAGLLLVLPAAAFRAIVPVLILIALVLVVAGPRIQARVHPEGDDEPVPRWHAPVMAAGVFAAGVYGGYFGAAQGVLLMGLLSALSLEPLQRLNGYKNVLSLVVNFVAATVFVLFAREHIDWLIVALIGVGAFVGGIIGARVGRRIPPNVLRGLIIAIGLVAIVKLVRFP